MTLSNYLPFHNIFVHNFIQIKKKKKFSSQINRAIKFNWTDLW